MIQIPGKKGKPSGSGHSGVGRKGTGTAAFLTFLSWLHTVLIFSGVYLMTAAVLQMTQRETAGYLAESAALWIPVILSWVLVRATRRLWLYLLGAVPILAAVFLVSGMGATFFLSALIFLFRCAAWIRKDESPSFLDGPRLVHGIFFLAYYFWALAAGAYFQLPWIRCLLAAEIFVCLIFRYLSGIEEYIRQKQRIASLPAGTIRQVSRMILGMLAAAFILLILPALLYGREPLIDVAEYLKNIRVDMPPAVMEEELMPGDMFGGGLPEELIGEPKKPGKLEMAFLNLLTAAAVTGAVLLMLFLIREWWRHMSGQFSRQEDEIAFLDDEMRTEAGMRRRGRGRRTERASSPNQKIRRFYRKMLKKKLPGRPGGWETPQELEQKALMGADGYTEELHALYEKARYSREGCSAAEAAALAHLPGQGRKSSAERK